MPRIDQNIGLALNNGQTTQRTGISYSSCYAAPMNFSFFLTITIMLLFGWVVTNPEAALGLISTLRRQFRQSMIQRYGN